MPGSRFPCFAKGPTQVLCLLSIPAVAAGVQTTSIDDLKRLSVEELMSVEVTSVSRTEETLGGAAAAVAVVTNEDIRRSGATTVAEALRLLPGIHVAHDSASTWAVSSRGFSSISSEKLLVLSDTRSIYTPLYSGVFWDVQDYLLEDVERIEVIRGPGAALWGSNAVNGVINITTRNARDTQGLYAEAGTGTEERALASARYGATTAGGISYRVFGKYSDHDASSRADPTRSDDWRLGHFGFRADWGAPDQDTWTVQGDLYHGNIGQLMPSVRVEDRPGATGDLQIGVSGGNVLGRWRHTIDADSDIQLRMYYDNTHRDDPSYEDDLHTVDLDFQHRFLAAARHEVIWGLNGRFMSNRNEGKGIFGLAPTSSDDLLVSAFVQDQIAVADAVHVTLGTKLEHNDFSGFEVQPSARVAWDVSTDQTLWAAISRAVRVPTRLERDISVDVSSPTGNPVIRLQGNRDFESEELLAYELGYRWQPIESVFMDLATFYNRYQKLASLELGEFFVDENGRTIVPIVNRNLTDADARGAEVLVTWSPLRTWRLRANYSYLDLELEARGLDLNRGRFYAGATPRHQYGLRSFVDLPGGLQLDAQLRRIGSIRSVPQIATGAGLPGYTELDVRLNWSVNERLDITVAGQNLLHSRHVEFATSSELVANERSVYGKVILHF
jgi:iron complex outermembrane receptor protein